MDLDRFGDFLEHDVRCLSTTGAAHYSVATMCARRNRHCTVLQPEAWNATKQQGNMQPTTQLAPFHAAATTAVTQTALDQSRLHDSVGEAAALQRPLPLPLPLPLPRPLPRLWPPACA